MARYSFEPLVAPTSETQDEDVELEAHQRPAWRWILRELIQPLCAEYDLIIEYEDEDDESCAIFYRNEWSWQ